MDIAEFLIARYAEVENALTHLPKRARELPWDLYQQGVSVQGGSRGRSVPWAVRVQRGEHAWTVADQLDRAIAEYLMRVGDPARVLADITAKRRRLERHRHFDFPANEDDGPGDYAWTPECDACHETWPCFELRNDASVYVDRPGYSADWAV